MNKKFKEKRGSQLRTNMLNNHRLLNETLSPILPTQKEQKEMSLPFYSNSEEPHFLPLFCEHSKSNFNFSKDSSFDIDLVQNPEELLQAYSLIYNQYPDLKNNSFDFLHLWEKQCHHNRSSFQVLIAKKDEKAIASSVLFLASHTAVMYLTTFDKSASFRECSTNFISGAMEKVKNLYYPGIGIMTNSETMDLDFLKEKLHFKTVA